MRIIQNRVYNFYFIHHLVLFLFPQVLTIKHLFRLFSISNRSSKNWIKTFAREVQFFSPNFQKE